MQPASPGTAGSFHKARDVHSGLYLYFSRPLNPRATRVTLTRHQLATRFPSHQAAAALIAAVFGPATIEVERFDA